MLLSTLGRVLILFSQPTTPSSHLIYDLFIHSDITRINLYQRHIVIFLLRFTWLFPLTALVISAKRGKLGPRTAADIYGWFDWIRFCLRHYLCFAFSYRHHNNTFHLILTTTQHNLHFTSPHNTYQSAKMSSLTTSPTKSALDPKVLLMVHPSSLLSLSHTDNDSPTSSNSKPNPSAQKWQPKALCPL